MEQDDFTWRITNYQSNLNVYVVMSASKVDKKPHYNVLPAGKVEQVKEVYELDFT